MAALDAGSVLSSAAQPTTGAGAGAGVYAGPLPTWRCRLPTTAGGSNGSYAEWYLSVARNVSSTWAAANSCEEDVPTPLDVSCAASMCGWNP